MNYLLCIIGGIICGYAISLAVMWIKDSLASKENKKDDVDLLLDDVESGKIRMLDMDVVEMNCIIVRKINLDRTTLVEGERSNIGKFWATPPALYVNNVLVTTTEPQKERINTIINDGHVGMAALSDKFNLLN